MTDEQRYPPNRTHNIKLVVSDFQSHLLDSGGGEEPSSPPGGAIDWGEPVWCHRETHFFCVHGVTDIYIWMTMM